MRKKLINYLNKLDGLDYSALEKEEKEEIKQRVFIQIQFFQHERMVHLIVLVTFAILEMLSLVGLQIAPSIMSLLLSGLFLILLIPYVYHYYILENGVQKMYTYYEQLL